jgi:hypothetical protein
MNHISSDVSETIEGQRRRKKKYADIIASNITAYTGSDLRSQSASYLARASVHRKATRMSLKHPLKQHYPLLRLIPNICITLQNAHTQKEI